MTTQPEFNQRMPFMPFNWFAHSARVGRLGYAERGLFDAVRGELWTVVGCKMPREALLDRLGITEGTSEAAMFARLERLRLLSLDADGRVFDEVQVREFSEAVRKAATNRANGAKGGRPVKEAQGPALPKGVEEDF